MKTDDQKTLVCLEKFGRTAGLVAAGLLAAFACKSFSIDENVYTGASSRAGARATGGSTSSAAGGTSSVTSGSAGKSTQGGGDIGEGGAADTGGAANGGSAGHAPEEPIIADEPFSKAALLRQVADCTVARYKDFEQQAIAFDAAAQANSSAPSAETALAAKDAWLAANASWQVAEVFRFGPAARSGDADPGAQELRDQIYAWRAGGRCPVEGALVDKAYAASNFGSSLVSLRGLGAAEYLLFYPGTDNDCPDYSAINAKGTWAALGDTEVVERKRDYAAAVAALVLSNTQRLLGAWDPDAGNFRKKLTEPGGGSVYANEQEALQAVFNGIFYIEKEVKDFKLGVPLAISECMNATCPELLESRFANVSTANIKQNYAGFRRLFQGCGGKYSGLGFDDWLDAVGATDLRMRMITALDGAQVAIDALDPPLEVSLTAHTDRVFAVYTALKQLTDLIKSEFVSVLNLDLPAGAGTDND